MADPQVEGPTGAPHLPAGFQATAGAYLKDGVLHVSDLYAGVVICWFVREEGFEPEEEHKEGDKKTQKDINSLQETQLSDDRTCNVLYPLPL